MVALCKRAGALILLCALLAGFSPCAGEVVWHGYMLNRVYQPEGGPTRFRTDRVSLSASAQIDPKFSAYVEVYYHPFVPAVAAAEPYRTYLESAYADVKLGKGTLRVGKGRRMSFAITPSYPNRKTSNYGIFSEAFTQDRAQGIQYFWADKGYEAGVAVMTGMRLGNRGIGDVTIDGTNVVRNLADRDVPHDISETLQVDARMGLVTAKGLRAGITGTFGDLDQSDVDFLNSGVFPAATHTSKTHDRYGAYFMYPWSDYVVQGQYMKAKTSDIKHSGWELLAGYNPKGMKPKAFVRYAVIDMDTPAVAASQYTWDKQQLALSVVKPLRPSVWLQFEYERNMESAPAGTPDVKNDIGFVELFTGF